MAEGSEYVTSSAHWGAFEAEIRDGRLVGVRPLASDREPSPMIAATPEIVYHPTRIDRPMVRQGFLKNGASSDTGRRGAEPFVPVEWNVALDLAADELERVRDTYGNQSIFGSSGWGSAGAFHRPQGQLSRFLNCYGGFVDQVTNYSFGAAAVLLPRVLGTMQPVTGPMTAWPTIAKHTGLMVAFGGLAAKNAQVNLGGLGSHDTMNWLRKAASAGVEFVSISPIKDDASGFLNATWLPIRPNTDTAMILALAHTLVDDGRHDQAFLDRYCTGFEEFRAYLMGETDGQPKDADWAAPIVEIDAGTLRTLARRMAETRTMIAVSWSVQRGDHGEQPYWAAIALAAILGQIGLPGGGFGFGYGANGGAGTPLPRFPLPGLPTGANPIAESFIPVARITDMLLDPGGEYDFNGERRTYPDVRLMYWTGGNPFHKQQDINRLLRGWRHVETVIVNEPWWTPVARHADIVFPATTTVERNDIGASRSDRFLIAMRKAIDPVGGARNDFDIFSALAERLDIADAFTEGRNEMQWLRHIFDTMLQQARNLDLDLPDFENLWRAGSFEVPAPENPPVLFADFRADPEANALKTPSGKIEITSRAIAEFGYDDCPGHPAWLEPAEWLGGAASGEYKLHLITNQPRHRLHSQMDMGPHSQSAKVHGREPVSINPRDAAARDILDGDLVRLFNGRGQCLAGAVVTDHVRPGVVQIATGAWYDPLDPASPNTLDTQGNPNVLTLDKGASRLTQSCAAQTALVEIACYTDPAPAVSVFDPPPIVSR